MRFHFPKAEPRKTGPVEVESYFDTSIGLWVTRGWLGPWEVGNALYDARGNTAGRDLSRAEKKAEVEKARLKLLADEQRKEFENEGEGVSTRRQILQGNYG